MKKAVLCALLVFLVIFGFTVAQASEATEVLWTNNNPNSVHNEAKDYYVVLELDKECVVTSIMTYHYFNGGALPGTIMLFSQGGEQWGPFQAEGVDGQGDVKNAYWLADVGEIRLSPGVYAIADSDQSTWSANEASDFYGIAELRGYYPGMENPFGTGTGTSTSVATQTQTQPVETTNAYAAQVLSFVEGEPWTEDERANGPTAVLGAPDYDSNADTNYLCMGAYGSIILEFDRWITDGDGVDIVVYEIGSGVEETTVEVSDDLFTWYKVGVAEGASSGVDLNGLVPQGVKFRYVCITDRDGGSGGWPGADIDAVEAVYTVPIEEGDVSTELTDLQILQQKAADGDAAAQYVLGEKYYYGTGVTQNDETAAYWFAKASEQEYVAAQSFLGYLYENGEGVPQDYGLAAAFYSFAAEQGDVYAQSSLGWLYDSGQGVPQDYEQAVYWYRAAAEQGDAYAQNGLGYMYDYGLGITQDYEQAVAWYRKAADQGLARGQYNLAIMYEDGLGVGQDLEQAIYWYQKAADQGYEDAQAELDRLRK